MYQRVKLLELPLEACVWNSVTKCYKCYKETDIFMKQIL